MFPCAVITLSGFPATVQEQSGYRTNILSRHLRGWVGRSKSVLIRIISLAGIAGYLFIYLLIAITVLQIYILNYSLLKTKLVGGETFQRVK